MKTTIEGDTILGFEFDGNYTVVIPRGVKYIHAEAMRFVTLPDKADGFSKIIVEGGNEYFYIKDRCLIERHYNTFICGTADCRLPNDVERIGLFAFNSNKRLRELTLSKAVNYIGRNAFTRSGLRKIIIPDTVDYIDHAAFVGCPDLKEIVVLGKHTDMQKSVFGKGLSEAIIRMRSPELTVRAPLGSTAERRAKESNVKFEKLEDKI